MNYTFTTINANEAIGNSLSATNANYSTLEFWTNNIMASSVQYFSPLLNFYLFYGDFWKTTINYAYSLNAPQRLSSFQTNVETNSAKWITPITFFYPTIPLFSASTLNTQLNTAVDWFRNRFPIFIGTNPRPQYAENTTAYLYCMFYREQLKVNQNVVEQQSRPCRTENRTAVANCHVIWQNNVTCYGRSVCLPHNSTPTRPTCRRNYTANCSYENGSQSISRFARANINNLFNDRFEHERIYCLVLKVKNCQWSWENTL